MRYLALALLVACSGAESEPTASGPPPAVDAAPAASPKVSRAVELAKALQAQPGNAEAALAAKNGSVAELEGLLYEIAADPALTDAYAKEMGR